MWLGGSGPHNDAAALRAVASRRPSCQTDVGTQDPRPVQRWGVPPFNSPHRVPHTRNDPGPSQAGRGRFVSIGSRHPQVYESTLRTDWVSVRRAADAPIDPDASRITDSDTSPLPQGSVVHRARAVPVDGRPGRSPASASAVGRAPQGEPHRMAHESDGTGDQPALEETHRWNLRLGSHGQRPVLRLHRQ